MPPADLQSVRFPLVEALGFADELAQRFERRVLEGEVAAVDEQQSRPAESECLEELREGDDLAVHRDSDAEVEPVVALGRHGGDREVWCPAQLSVGGWCADGLDAEAGQPLEVREGLGGEAGRVDLRERDPHGQ